MRKVTKRWTTKSGEKVRICDMSDRHLLNTMRMLSRQASAYYPSALHQGYAVLGSLNGEMAFDTMDRELGILSEAGPGAVLPEIYSSLEDEAERRGLETFEDDSILPYGGNF